MMLDEVSNEQLLLGLSSLEYAEQSTALLAILAERMEVIDDSIAQSVIEEIMQTCETKLLQKSLDNVQLELLLSITTNVTISELHCTIFVDKYCTEKDSSFINHLLTKFCGFDLATSHELDPWEHVASILCNISRFETGRSLVLNKSSGFMEKLLQQV